VHWSTLAVNDANTGNFGNLGNLGNPGNRFCHSTLAI